MKNKWYFLVLVFFAFCFLGSCVKAISPIKFAPIPQPSIETHPSKSGYPKWIFEANERIVSTPAVGVDGTIYITTLDRSLFAINNQGKKKWPKPFKTDEIVLSSPATSIDGTGTVYITSKDRNIYAVVDGIERWRYTTGGVIDSSPWVTPTGTIYVASQDFNLYSLSPDGKALWENPYQAFDKFRQATPEVATDGTIYIGSQDGVLHAVASNGSKKWANKICDKITSSAKVDADGTIYIGCWEGSLKAIKQDGSELWTFKVGQNRTDKTVMGKAILTQPALDSDGILYFGSDDGYLYALDSKTGAQKWSFQTGKYTKNKAGTWVRQEGTEGYIQASAVIGPNGNVFFGSVNEYFYNISKTGELQWQFDARGWVDKAPRIGRSGGKDFAIYLAAGKRLFAINP